VTKQTNMTPLLIDEETIPKGYAQIIRHICNNAGGTISPLILSIANDGADEMIGTNSTIQVALDSVLGARGESDVETVAFTIFPDAFYKVASDRDELFTDYRDAFPRLQALNHRNKRGLYFERLTMWPGGPCDGKQLEWIIQQYTSRPSVRASMFQASVFNPGVDHTGSAQLGFPCLQHVSFVPTAEELVVNAFYATQQLLFKAYGNYLGLIRLGDFMASEMGLKFARLNVTVGVAKLEGIGKTTPEFKPVLTACDAILNAP